MDSDNFLTEKEIRTRLKQMCFYTDGLFLPDKQFLDLNSHMIEEYINAINDILEGRYRWQI